MNDTSAELIAKARDSITDWEDSTAEIDIELLDELTERLEAAEAVVAAARNALQADFDQQTKAMLGFELGTYDGRRLLPKQV